MIADQWHGTFCLSFLVSVTRQQHTHASCNSSVLAAPSKCHWYMLHQELASTGAILRLSAPARWHTVICSRSPLQAVKQHVCSELKAHVLLHLFQVCLYSCQLRGGQVIHCRVSNGHTLLQQSLNRIAARVGCLLQTGIQTMSLLP